MHNKTVEGGRYGFDNPFSFASPFSGIDPSKGPIANSRRAAALALAVQRAPLSWQGDELFKLADKFVEYISGERAEEAEPKSGYCGPFYRDPQSRMWAWDNCHELYREVVYK